MGQPVVHFEVVGKDGGKLQGYYAELFGWKMNADNPMNYALVEAERSSTGMSIPGASGQRPEGYGAHITFDVEVPGGEASLRGAERLGAPRVMGPEAIME